MSSPTPEKPVVSRSRAILLETVAVLSCLYVPSAVSAFIPSDTRSSTFLSEKSLVTGTVSHLGSAGLILFIIWSSGDGLAYFGVPRFNWRRDLPWALAAFAIELGAQLLADAAFGLPITGLAPAGSYQMVQMWEQQIVGIFHLLVLAVWIVSSSFQQELLLRSYSITRLKELFGNVPVAIFVSGLMFGAWHYYQGPLGVLPTLAIGMIYGLIFVKTNSIWPLVISHTLYNGLVYFG